MRWRYGLCSLRRIGFSFSTTSKAKAKVLAYYVNELRARGLDGASIYLPHDGMNTSVITGKRLEDHLRDAGFSVTSVKNQGPGAAAIRIEAARRIFPRVWF